MNSDEATSPAAAHDESAGPTRAELSGATYWADWVGRKVGRAVRRSYQLGGALALVASYHQHESLLWALLHGAMSWLYVAYFAVMR